MFERPPDLVRALLGDAVAELPLNGPARVASNEFGHYKPTNYHADLVLVFGAPPSEIVVIIEVQRRFLQEKLRVWPFYVSSVWQRDGCPVVLLVLCDDAEVAAQYDRPIELGRAAVVYPDVVGPDRVPVVRDAGLAREIPELSVMSAVLHYDRPDSDRVFAALAAALMTVGTGLGRQYYDFVLAEVPRAWRAHLQEVVMRTVTPEYRSEYNRALFSEGEAVGKAEGKAEAILTVLESRQFTLSDEVRNRIGACTDLVQLDGWLRRVGSVRTVEELLD